MRSPHRLEGRTGFTDDRDQDCQGQQNGFLYADQNLPSSSPAPLIAVLIPPTLQPRRRYRNKYCVQFNDELIAVGHDAELDSCRWLFAHGYRGQLRIVDSITNRLRLTVDIERGAKLTVKETAWGPRFVRFQSVPERAPVAEDEEARP